ncbi:MAG: hypothetical protein R3E42_02540 [Burkholderiaceae bacterium]
MSASRNTTLWLTALGLVLLCAAGSARADTALRAGGGHNLHRLDDSRSHPASDNLQMEWLPQNRSDPGAGMQASVRVNIDIDTADWQGRTGRIYMVLPRDQAGSSVQADWTTQGKLRSGRLVSGERTMVYAGRIDSPRLRDEMLVRLRTAPDWQSNSRRLNFYFEIDVLD